MNLNFAIRTKPKAIAFLVCTFLSMNAYGGYNFNAGFFKSAGLLDSEKDINLDVFNQGGEFLPGIYQMSVYVNGKYIKKKDISFQLLGLSKKIMPCFTEEDFDSLGINLPWENLGECFISDAKNNFQWKVDMNSMRLDIILPQIFVEHGERFLTPWQSWEQSANVAMFNYDYNYNSSKLHSNREDNQYLGFENGLNFQDFRLRNQSVWTRSNNRGNKIDSLRTYIQKDYHYLQGGEFTAGKIYSDGGFFESIPFKGVMLSSNDQMLKSSFRDFTPEVLGVVQSSSAMISVIKNGVTIYQTTLPSGPFALKDIMTNGGGEYEIKINEADGSVRSYLQSSESVPELLSDGRFKYNLIAGKTDIATTENSDFGQLYLGYGVSNWYSIYGGSLFSSDYLSTGFGNGFLIDGFGAVSADLTLSKSQDELRKISATGKSFRTSYYKELDATATSLGLFAYRYSSEGYLQFDEYLNKISGNNIHNKKNKIEIIVKQKLGDAGYVTFSGKRQSYWSGEGSNTGIGFNHNINFGRVSINSYYEHDNLSDGRKDKFFGVQLSYSLYEKGKGISLSNRFSHENGNQSYQTAVNVSPFDDGNLNISANSLVKENKSNQYGVFTNYRGSISDIAASYDKSSEMERLSTSMRGGGMLHADGVTLSRRMSMDLPVAIVRTPGVSGVKVNNQNNVLTDYFGSALITNLQPYQENKISIDVTSIDEYSDVVESDKKIIPRKGGVIPVYFDVLSGNRAIFNVKYNGNNIPLGAVASISDKLSKVKTAFFADQGQVYLTGLEKEGVVNVRWGKTLSSQCSFQFSLVGQEHDFLHKKTVECY